MKFNTILTVAVSLFNAGAAHARSVLTEGSGFALPEVDVSDRSPGHGIVNDLHRREPETRQGAFLWYSRHPGAPYRFRLLAGPKITQGVWNIYGNDDTSLLQAARDFWQGMVTYLAEGAGFQPTDDQAVYKYASDTTNSVLGMDWKAKFLDIDEVCSVINDYFADNINFLPVEAIEVSDAHNIGGELVKESITVPYPPGGSRLRARQDSQCPAAHDLISIFGSSFTWDPYAPLFYRDTCD